MTDNSLRIDDLEDEIDLGLYYQAMSEHKEDSQTISFEDMLKEIAD